MGVIQIASLLTAENASAQQIYTTLLDRKQNRRINEEADKPKQSIQLDIIWSMSFDQITADAKAVLGVLCMYSADDIPLDLFLPQNQDALGGFLCVQLPADRNEVAEIAPFDELHRKEVLTVRLSDLVDRDDVFVLERPAQFGLTVKIKPGETGHFDVFHEGQMIASKRRAGPNTTLFGTGLFPPDDGVVEAIAHRLAAAGK